MPMCGKCKNLHDTVDNVKICYGLLPREAVRPYTRVLEPTTPAQVNYVTLLGGDVEYAKRIGKNSTSVYIDQLKKKGGAVSSPTTLPVAPDPKLNFFSTLINSLPDGRYAARMDETEAMRFFRVKRHTRGRFVGCLQIQTQHSERLMNAAIRLRDQRWLFDSHYRYTSDKDKLLDLLLLVCADPQTAGFNYAKELGRCRICGKTLTDERSRWYGIGPDCETRYSHLIEWVDEQHDGKTYEQMMYLASR